MHDAFLSYNQAADDRLAAALEAGLERLAKPLFKLRAIDVFRDKTGMAASPGLWSSLESHLSGSRWLIYPAFHPVVELLCPLLFLLTLWGMGWQPWVLPVLWQLPLMRGTGWLEVGRPRSEKILLAVHLLYPTYLAVPCSTPCRVISLLLPHGFVHTRLGIGLAWLQGWEKNWLEIEIVYFY